MTREPLLSTVQVARMLGVSPRSVRRWVKDGHMRATKTETGYLRFTRSEVRRIEASMFRS